MYNFDYFYGNEAEQYQFYMIPQLLFTDNKFRKLSSDAKILYGLLLDRSGLSYKNKDRFTDESGRTFIYFTQETAMEMLNCAKDKAIKTFKELENIGLIEKKRQGLGKPTKIYVKHFNRLAGEPFSPRNTGNFSEVGKTDFLKSEISTSASRKNRPLEVGKTDTNHTNINQTDINHTEFNHSFSPQPQTSQQPQTSSTDKEGESERVKSYYEILSLIQADDYILSLAEQGKVKSDKDLRNFDENDRNVFDCSIPYSLKENKKAMTEALRYISAYSYHENNREKEINSRTC